MKTILITGGTGLIGKDVGLALVKKGVQVIGLTRNPNSAQLTAPYPAQWIKCDLEKEAPNLSTYSIDGVIHLAGESVGDQKWSEDQKEKILNSRTQGTKNLALALQSQKNLQFIIGAAAIGIYRPTTGEEIADEHFPQGDGFLAKVSQDWEKSYSVFPAHLRTVLYRIGVVLSTDGGALPRMIFPAQIFASSALGDGRQWLSWVHLKDVVNAFVTATENERLSGIYNLVAPLPSQQLEFADLIAENMQALKGPPVPKFMLNLILGEQAQLAIASLKISSQRLQASGFRFQFNTLSEALSDLLKDWKNGRSVKVFRQYFHLPREKVFSFFCDTNNLEKITPPTLNFQVLKVSTPQLSPGTLIDYKLKIHGFPIQWTTLIETWEKNVKFTDTQKKGPYSLWHHTHLFEDLGSGTLMTDVLIYKLPAGLIGRTSAQALVDSDVSKIFEFRRRNVSQYL